MPARDLFREDSSFLDELKKRGYRPAVVYDVGASTGVWSDLVQQSFPGAEIHLFEPLAAEVAAYRTDLESRTRRFPNMHLHAVALGREVGAKQLFASRDAYGSSLLDRGEVPDVEDVVRVPVWRLDEYRAEAGFPPPDLMKLDCQGAEVEILDGAVECLRGAKVLMVESWLMRSRAYGPTTPLVTELIDYLDARGFVCVDFGQRFYDEEHRLYSVDCFFIAKAALEEVWLRPVLSRKIAALHQQITHLEAEIRERDQTIEYCRAEVDERDRTIDQLRADLDACHAGHARAMAEIRNSLSWKLTAPLRWWRK